MLFPGAEPAEKLHFGTHLTSRVLKEGSGPTQLRVRVARCAHRSASSSTLLDCIYYLRSPRVARRFNEQCVKP